MEVFVLMGHINYEDSFLLGVYYTLADAKFHREVFINSKGENAFDGYSIERRVIGARAETDIFGEKSHVEVV